MAKAGGGCSTLTAVGGRLAVCRVSGAVDRTTVARLRDAMVALAEHPAAVLDLSGACFIDAAGLSAIVACVRRSAETGGELVIVAAKPHIVRLFDIIGVSRLVPVVSSTHDALRALDDRSGRPR